MRVVKSEFFAGAKLVDSLPGRDAAEIAIVGRSNVGKSTFINRLTGNSKLARTSSTPGRTREINLFSIELEKKSGKRTSVTLADLPGFGFAKLSKTEREMLSMLCVDYIQNRKSLRVVCLLNDCRRDPQEDEIAVRELAFEADRRLLVILTKADKLKRNELSKRIEALAKSYGLEKEDLIVSGDKINLEEFWKRIFLALSN